MSGGGRTESGPGALERPRAGAECRPSGFAANCPDHGHLAAGKLESPFSHQRCPGRPSFIEPKLYRITFCIGPAYFGMVENMPSPAKHALTPKTPQNHQSSILGVAQPNICILGMVENMPSPQSRLISSGRRPEPVLDLSGTEGPTDAANWYLLAPKAPKLAGRRPRPEGPRPRAPGGRAGPLVNPPKAQMSV